MIAASRGFACYLRGFLIKVTSSATDVFLFALLLSFCITFSVVILYLCVGVCAHRVHKRQQCDALSVRQTVVYLFMTSKAVITIAIRLRYDYDTTIPRRIRLYDGSDRNYDLRSIRLRYDYDPTTTYRARLLPFDAIRREQKRTIFRRSRVVVVSQSNRNCDIGFT